MLSFHAKISGVLYFAVRPIQRVKNHVIGMKEALVRQHQASLVKGRWPSASEVGGIRSTDCGFAEDLGEHVSAYRRNPPTINCCGNLLSAPFNKGAMMGAAFVHRDG